MEAKLSVVSCSEPKSVNIFEMKQVLPISVM